MTDIVLRPAWIAADGTESILPGASYYIRPWNMYANSSGQMVNTYSAPITIRGAAVTIPLDPSSYGAGPYEFQVRCRDFEGNNIIRTQYSTVPDDGTFNLDDLPALDPLTLNPSVPTPWMKARFRTIGSFTVLFTTHQSGTVTFTATGRLTATVHQPTIPALLATTGALTATVRTNHPIVAAPFRATGALAAAIVRNQPITTALFTASGALTANTPGRRLVTALFTATGALTATASPVTSDIYSDTYSNTY